MTHPWRVQRREGHPEPAQHDRVPVGAVDGVVDPRTPAPWSLRNSTPYPEEPVISSIRKWPRAIAISVTAFAGALLIGLFLASPAQAVVSTTWLQRDLAGIGYLPTSGVDGKYGPQTRAAVRGFQHDNGLAEDGVYGSRTELALRNKVKRVQRVAATPADGQYGTKTTVAVRAWQGRHHLAGDGIAGPKTMGAMHVARTVWITAQWKIAQHGWSVTAQFGCLNNLWNHESNWKVYATNPRSGAFGIPQSLPPNKMAAAGPDWRTNPATQIEWGLDYIKGRYGTPCKAWTFWQSHDPHWY
jgi:peptidoglycan hydrolase-like protein with peptidoglycan-binding domain